jgi:hypothetical protein
MERVQNRFLLTALRGWLVAALAVAVLSLAPAARVEGTALDSPDARTGPSVSGGPAAPQQEALHLVTATPGGARLAPSGGGAPVLSPPVPALRPADGPSAPVAAPALPPRPSRRILFCTWLN